MKKLNQPIDYGGSLEKMKRTAIELEGFSGELLMGLIDSRQIVRRNEFIGEGYAEAYAFLAAKVKMYLIRTTELSTLDIDRMLAPLPSKEKQS